MLADHYRYLVVVVGLLCLVSICSNYVVINFTFICMKDDFSAGYYSLSENKTRSVFDYTPDEKKYIIWAVAVGTITGTFPINYFFVRYGAKWPFFLCGILSAVTTSLIPFAATFNYTILLFVRCLQGVSFAADFAAIGMLTVRWAPLSETAIILSVLTCFTSLSSVFTNAASGPLCEEFGWRMAFYMHAVIGTVLFLVWLAVYTDNPHLSTRISKREQRKIQKNKSEQHIKNKDTNVPYKKLLTSPVLLTVWFNAFAEMSVIMFLHTYAPTFFNRVLKFDVAETGYLVAMAVLVQIPMKLVGGFISDKAKCFSEKSKMLFFNTIAVGVVGVLFCILAYIPPSHHFLAVILFSIIFTCLSFNTAGFYKCATLHTRQFAHVVIASIQWMKSVALITGPALVAAVVKDETDVGQWRVVLIALGSLMILANALSFFVFTDKPAPWTSSKVAPVQFESKVAEVEIIGKPRDTLVCMQDFGVHLPVLKHLPAAWPHLNLCVSTRFSMGMCPDEPFVKRQGVFPLAAPFFDRMVTPRKKTIPKKEVTRRQGRVNLIGAACFSVNLLFGSPQLTHTHLLRLSECDDLRPIAELNKEYPGCNQDHPTHQIVMAGAISVAADWSATRRCPADPVVFAVYRKPAITSLQYEEAGKADSPNCTKGGGAEQKPQQLPAQSTRQPPSEPMSISDYWQFLSANPSPVPSYASTSASNEEHDPKVDQLAKIDLGYAAQLTQMQMMWNPMLLQQFLTLFQLQQPICLKPEEIPTKNVESRKRPLAMPDLKKTKLRKIGEDIVTNSPVSGMFIKEESAVPPVEELQKEADLLDETAAYVEVTEESRSKIEEIPNVIGDCVCRLCKVKYEDVFKLAQHRCPRIAHEEYKCPECEKSLFAVTRWLTSYNAARHYLQLLELLDATCVLFQVFSCPANLASHRRWHKPREPAVTTTAACESCGAVFASKKQLKSHVSACHLAVSATPTSVLQNLLSQVIPAVGGC
ncbi:unnamed protein product [Caenorhabditis auriculariae]|uniref:Major facilitator superfamily (MFS) profile domain-containing protein n=1 Tax=Caenorhabditis auriculariae TaxID=2777116 RepID=A0A8S1HN48_9PELO|nr:unnamed protein product [Caenorhabditis auriculariae]